MDLTVRELAKLLGVPEKTVYRWIEKEGLPAYRLHEQYRLNRVEVQE
ncbi:MAG: helix-turn-helix domain-containing protein, partial [Candidatus Binatia bacterium]